MTACRFEKLDHKEVLESSGRLTTLMRAIDKIENNADSSSLEPDDKLNIISSIRERVGDKHYFIYGYKGGSLISIVEQKGDITNVNLFLDVPDSHFSPVDPTLEIRDVHGNIELLPTVQELPEPQERRYDYFLNRCDEYINNTVFEALDYFAKKTVPITLRQTYEVIKKDEGGKYQLLKNNNR